MTKAVPMLNDVRRTVKSVCWALALVVSACGPGVETGAPESGSSVRILSWNVASDAFVRDLAGFRALVRRTQADLLLLDEVAPHTEAALRDALSGLPTESQVGWSIDFGQSGGRQRNVIASRGPVEPVAELAGVVSYPDAERRRIQADQAAAGDESPQYAMDGGIPVNGVVVLVGGRRLLTVSIDLQSGGDDPGGWREYRRQIESAEIRRRINLALERIQVDGIIVAGDFNLVSTPLPLVIASGPYKAPHDGLLAAELRHLDGVETWTIENRGRNAFPNAPLDYLLYSPRSLMLRRGYVFDSADLAPDDLERSGLLKESANRLSDHRALVAEFVWR